MNKPTIAQAFEALEDLDDFARMSVSVAPIGAYKVLREFLEFADTRQAQIDGVVLKVAEKISGLLVDDRLIDFTHALLSELAKEQEPVEFHLCEGCGHYYQIPVSSCDCMADLPLRLVVMYPYPQPELAADNEQLLKALERIAFFNKDLGNPPLKSVERSMRDMAFAAHKSRKGKS